MVICPLRHSHVHIWKQSFCFEIYIYCTHKVHIRSQDVNWYTLCDDFLIHCSSFPLHQPPQALKKKKQSRFSTENHVCPFRLVISSMNTSNFNFPLSFSLHVHFEWFITVCVSWSCLGKDVSALGRSRHERWSPQAG